ncbi:Tic22-like family protein [Nitzschia inconspicua]|uniref:Tic22-like family protein n=1 Tax=Nitzschia inconspicua TaxID=303405 RepID=A0A9K3KTG8_9STRA|nr:Tic22-like family protein [Nitzschia inconspicua]
MNRYLSTIFLFLSVLTPVSSTPRSFSRGVGTPLFGIRGGGLFGGKDEKGSSDSSTATIGDKKMYPAMSQEEVEDWLEHIPVFAVTDASGSGVVLKPDNDTSVFYFFLNPLSANATLSQLKSVNEDMDLKVSAFSLGKIWFKLLNSDPNQEVLLKPPGGDDESTKVTKGVEYRLVPDTRDLLGARMLLTMSPEDGEKLKAGETMTPEMAQKAVEKAMTESPKFKETFNEIPIFTIAQMRMQKQLSEGETGEPVTLLPMYFSLQNMVGTWQQFMSQSSPEMQGIEPAINLLSLHDLVEMMQKESEIDFRHVVLVPPVPESAPGQLASGGAGGTSTSSMGGMGGATLGDI